MRLKRDYLKFLKNKFSWMLSRFKPLTVHTEAIFIDSIWEEVKKRVKENKVHVWHLMTPVNYELYRSSFNTRLSKNEISKIMKKRYLWMKENNQKLELHIHLSLTMNQMSYQEQEKMFKEAISWMKKELSITPTEFVPGWWSYNQDTIKLCNKYKLKLIREYDYDYTHDYHWIL